MKYASIQVFVSSDGQSSSPVSKPSRSAPEVNYRIMTTTTTTFTGPISTNKPSEVLKLRGDDSSAVSEEMLQEVSSRVSPFAKTAGR